MFDEGSNNTFMNLTMQGKKLYSASFWISFISILGPYIAMRTHNCICKKTLHYYQKSNWKYCFVQFNVIKNNLLTQFYIRQSF